MEKYTKRTVLISLLLFLNLTSYAVVLLVETESFGDKGGWVLDQQFMDQMGSPYLMAHGMGKPVANATTNITFPPETGTYYIYVRTFNWTSPWTSTNGPGKFTLKIGNKKLPVVLGDKGSEWMWQSAGKITVKDLQTTVSLVDLTGFNGRCDAIYFTTEERNVPPSDIKELALFRKKMLNIPAIPPEETESYDFVVVGGGIAGMCASAAASRLGCKVALINDRPVLGGNNSSEIRVHLGGSIELEPNKGLGRMIREFGHSREATPNRETTTKTAKRVNLSLMKEISPYIRITGQLQSKRMEIR